MAENINENESIVSVLPEDWNELNKPPHELVRLATKLVAMDSLDLKDTITMILDIPINFRRDILPPGLEPDSLEVDLLDRYYNSVTTCQHEGCGVTMRNFVERVLHHAGAHHIAPMYMCAEHGCLHVFKSFTAARLHFSECHHSSRVLGLGQAPEDASDDENEE